MRPSDAIELVALVMERWPSLRLNVDQQKRYAEDIAQLDADVTRAAVDAIHREGGDFAPTAGDVVRRCALLELAPPEWVDVKRQLIHRHVALQNFVPPEWTCPARACDGSGFVEIPNRYRAMRKCSCHAERTAARRLADSLDPLVREFIDQNYVTWAEVDAVGKGAGTKEVTTLEAQMRTKWEAFSSRAVESRALASIGAAPELARLEQARQEDEPRRRRRGELNRPDFAAALPAAR